MEKKQSTQGRQAALAEISEKEMEQCWLKAMRQAGLNME